MKYERRYSGWTDTPAKVSFVLVLRTQDGKEVGSEPVELVKPYTPKQMRLAIQGVVKQLEDEPPIHGESLLALLLQQENEA